jgi:hypothetical protein
MNNKTPIFNTHPVASANIVPVKYVESIYALSKKMPVKSAKEYLKSFNLDYKKVNKFLGTVIYLESCYGIDLNKPKKKPKRNLKEP